MLAESIDLSRGNVNSAGKGRRAGCCSIKGGARPNPIGAFGHIQMRFETKDGGVRREGGLKPAPTTTASTLATVLANLSGRRGFRRRWGRKSRGRGPRAGAGRQRAGRGGDTSG